MKCLLQQEALSNGGQMKLGCQAELELHCVGWFMLYLSVGFAKGNGAQS